MRALAMNSTPGFALHRAALSWAFKTYSFSNTSDRIFRPCRISGLRRGLHGGFLYTRRALAAADLFEQLADAGAADVVGLGQFRNRPGGPATALRGSPAWAGDPAAALRAWPGAG